MIKKFFVILSLLYVGNAFAGESSGYTVSNVTPGSNYEKLGLQTGDVILSYDGKPVDSPKDSMDLYNEMKKGNVTTVAIKRDGKKKSLNIK